MTYLIAGRIPELTFAIADCYAEGEFSEKIYQLKSVTEPTYCVLSGSSFIMYCLISLDEWYNEKDGLNDFLNGKKSFDDLVKSLNFISKLYKFKSPTEMDWGRLIFITNDKVVFFDLFFDNNYLQEKNTIRIELKDYEYVDSYKKVELAFKKLPNDLNKDGVISHSIDHLCKISKGQFNKQLRHSVLLLNNGNPPVFNRPNRMFSDELIRLFTIGYDKLDSPESFDVKIIAKE
jgi:hypothetical protein